MNEPLQALHQLTPTQFEQVVAELLTAMGYQGVHRVGGPNDQGVDILCTDHHGIPVAVQCKRYTLEARIGAPAIQHLSAMAVRRHAHRCIFVTTADYTASARRQAENFDVELISGADLLRLVDEYPWVFGPYGIGNVYAEEPWLLEEPVSFPLADDEPPVRKGSPLGEKGEATLTIIGVGLYGMFVVCPYWTAFGNGWGAFTVLIVLPVIVLFTVLWQIDSIRLRRERRRNGEPSSSRPWWRPW